MRRKLSWIIYGIVVLIVIINWSTIFQEGNPVPVFAGIARLSLNESDIIRISDKPEKYITKSTDGDKIIKDYMEKRGFEFTEQLGSGYVFTRNDSQTTITGVQYTKAFKIWKFPRN